MRSTHQLPAPSSSASTPSLATLELTTHLLDLDDDIFGLIHASLDKRAAKALRHSCRAMHRSPTINAQISHLFLKVPCREQEFEGSESQHEDESGGEDEYENEGGSEDEPDAQSDGGAANVDDVTHTWVREIASFPRHAALRSLCIGVEQYIHILKMGYLERLLLRLLESPAAARLKTVTHLEIQRAELNEGCTAALLELFKGKLTLMGCIIYRSSLCCLSSSLQDLALMGCHFIGSLTDLGTLTQLRSLSFASIFPQEIDLCCLAQLCNLHTLSIQRCSLKNLDAMLQSVPLRSLILKFMDSYDMPSGINFASGTLRLLELHGLEMRNFQLMLHELPSIQCVSVTSMELWERSGELQRVPSAAVALSKFPLTVPAQFRLGLCHQHGCSVEQQANSLHALLPLRPVLSLHVQELWVYHCILDRKNIQALHSLFGSSVHSLHLSTSNMSSKEGLLMDILQGLPSVLCVSLNVTDTKVPEWQWWLTELLSVHQARREVMLKLITGSGGSAMYDTYKKLAHAWLEAQSSFPGPSTVRLDFLRYSIFGGLEQDTLLWHNVRQRI